MTIISEIKKSHVKPFRKLYMKRRQIDGEYETDWQLIDNEYIHSWGKIDFGVDDIKVNFFKYGAFGFSVKNDTGYFSDVGDDKSFFYNYSTRFRTLIKVDAGYYDTDGSELPTSPTIFVGLLSKDFIQKDNTLIRLKADHISSVLDEFPAVDIIGLGSSLTAYEIIEKVRDHTDTSNNLIFQKYIPTWNIDSATTIYYNMATTGALDGLSVFELFEGLAEAENYLMYISRDGEFNWQTKDTTQSTSVYHFSGYGDTDKTYGTNVMANFSVDANLRQVYNRVRVKHEDSDTLTSYYTKSEVWTWGDSSSSAIYGVQSYEIENEFLESTTAITVGDAVYDEFRWPKKLVKIKSKFVPQLNVADRVDLTYKTVSYVGNYLWGHFEWGDPNGVWGKRLGKNINIDAEDFLVLNIKHNIKQFSTNLVLREL